MNRNLHNTSFPRDKGESLQKLTASLSKDINSLSTAISNTNQQISTLEEKLENSDLSTITDKLTTYDEKFAEADEKLEDMRIDVGNNALSISSLSVDISQHEQQISTLEEKLENSDLSTITDKLTEYDEKFAEADEKLEEMRINVGNNALSISSLSVKNAEQDADILSNANEIAGVKNSLSTLSSTVAENTDAISGHSSTLNTLLSDNTTNKTNIAKNTSDISANKTDITTLLETTSTHTEELATLRALVESGGGSTGGSGETGGGTSGDSSDIVARLDGLELQLLENAETLKPLKIISESSSNIVDVREFSNNEFNIYEHEAYTHNGGITPDYPIGRKGANMFGAIWARINPRYNSVFSGNLVLTLSGVPDGKTQSTLTLTIDGVASQLTASIDASTLTITLPFNLTASRVCHTFRVDFADSELADATLCFMRLEVDQGANFACLNRDKKYCLTTLYSSTNRQYIFLTKNLGDSRQFTYLYKNYGEADQRTASFTIDPFEGNFLDQADSEHYFSTCEVYHEVKYTLSSGKVATGLVYDVLGLERDTSRLLCGNTQYDYVYVLCEDVVYDASRCCTQEFVIPTNKKTSDYYTYCGTTYENRAFICTRERFNASEEITLNGEALPCEFVQARGVVDNGPQIVGKFSEQSGYVLLHKTGDIYFLPEKNASYMIWLGRGKNINAYLQYANVPSHDPETATTSKYVNPLHVRTGEMNVYFSALDGSHVVKRVLKFDSELGRWVLTPTVSLFHGLDAIYELDWGRIIAVRNRSYEITSK